MQHVVSQFVDAIREVLEAVPAMQRVYTDTAEEPDPDLRVFACIWRDDLGEAPRPSGTGRNPASKPLAMTATFRFLLISAVPVGKDPGTYCDEIMIPARRGIANSPAIRAITPDVLVRTRFYFGKQSGRDEIAVYGLVTANYSATPDAPHVAVLTH